MTRRTRIILESDDLGKNVAVNDSVFSLMDDGRLTSAGLMMNAPATEDALCRIPRYPRCSFGIHLNATEFTPLSKHPGLAPLLNSHGEFCVNIRYIHIGRELREGIFAEWCAQIERALGLGVPVSHLNSNLHVHTMLPFMPVLKRLREKYEIRRIRLTRNLYGPHEKVSRQLQLKKTMWNFALHHYVGAQTADWFGGFLTWHERMQAGLPVTGTVELMTHPGNPGHDTETRLLWGPWKEEFAPNAELISYHEL